MGGDLPINGYLDLTRQPAEALEGGWLHGGDLDYLHEEAFL